LPKSLYAHLKNHLREVKALHNKDINEGFGSVELPYALQRKYPYATKEFIWQSVFLATTRYFDKVNKTEKDIICMKVHYKEK